MNETRAFSAASFNHFLREKKLMGSSCTRCGRLFLPPRAICPDCHTDQMEWKELSGQGRLAAFTSIFITPTFMNKAGFNRTNPYVSGVVELAEGVKISGRILEVDARQPENIQIGTPLQVAFVDQGEGDQFATFLAFQPTSRD